MKVSRVEAPRCGVGEGPVWDVAEQALYFVDIVGRAVFRHDPASEQTRRWDVPGVIGSMALRAGGGAIVALADGVHTLDFESGAVTPFALARDLPPRVQFNDGKVDRRGRFLVGTTDTTMQAPKGDVFRLDPSGALTVVDRGITISNGPCWSPDDRTFYFTDSLPNYRMYAYDYDIADGTLANRRTFVETQDLGGFPDGTTVDRDGLIWTALCEGGKVVAFTPDGKVERVVEMPVPHPASVMFGGPDLDRLYVTTIDPTVFPGRSPVDGAGDLYVIDGLSAVGLPEPRFGG